MTIPVLQVRILSMQIEYVFAGLFAMLHDNTISVTTIKLYMISASLCASKDKRIEDLSKVIGRVFSFQSWTFITMLEIECKPCMHCIC